MQRQLLQVNGALDDRVLVVACLNEGFDEGAAWPGGGWSGEEWRRGGCGKGGRAGLLVGRWSKQMWRVDRLGDADCGVAILCGIISFVTEFVLVRVRRARSLS